MTHRRYPAATATATAVAAGLLWLPSCGPPEPTGPPLRVDAAEFDGGPVPEGAAFRHVFRVENVGRNPVVVSDVDAHCGCLTPEEFPAKVAGGRSAEFPVSLDTRRTGTVGGAVDIHYRVAGRPHRLRLNLIASVTAVGKLTPDPAVLNFADLERGEAVRREVRLNLPDPDQHPVSVLRVDAPGWLSVRTTPDGTGLPRWRLELEGVAPAAPGTIDEEIVVRTDHPRYDRIVIPVLGEVRGGVTVEPRSLVQVVGGTVRKAAVATVRARPGVRIGRVTGRLRAPGAGRVATESDAAGVWRVELPEPAAAGPRVERQVLEVEVVADRGDERHAVPVLILRPAGAE